MPVEKAQGTSRRRAGHARAVPDPAPITGELSDEDLRAEIELLAELIAAVGPRRGRLQETEIDRLLGVEPRRAPPRRGGAP